MAPPGKAQPTRPSPRTTSTRRVQPPPQAPEEFELALLRQEVAALRQEVAALRQEVAAFWQEVAAFRQELAIQQQRHT